MNVWQKSIIDLEAVISGLRDRAEKAEAARDQLAVNYMERTLERNAAEAKRDEALKALEPFAKALEDVGPHEPTYADNECYGGGACFITYGDLRAARAAGGKL